MTEPVGGGLLVVLHGAIATVRIQRPASRNALDRATSAELVEAVHALDGDPAVRVIVLTGEGELAFCAGQDLKERARESASARHPAARPSTYYRSPAEALWEVTTPTIAAINGDAVGLGVELALACDLRYISESARFALPEAKRGIGARFAAAVLARQLPPAIYFQWCYLGDFIPAAELARWGVVNRVVERDVLGPAMVVAEELVQRAPLSLAHFKAFLVRGRDMPVASAVRAGFHPDPFSSDDAREGVEAFVQKRSPVWQGR